MQKHENNPIFWLLYDIFIFLHTVSHFLLPFSSPTIHLHFIHDIGNRVSNLHHGIWRYIWSNLKICIHELFDIKTISIFSISIYFFSSLPQAIKNEPFLCKRGWIGQGEATDVNMCRYLSKAIYKKLVKSSYLRHWERGRNVYSICNEDAVMECKKYSKNVFLVNLNKNYGANRNE